MRNRLAPTKALPPTPPHFAENFVKGGWRRVERVYGCRDDVVLKWIELCGGMDALRARRIAWLRTQAEAARNKVSAR